MIFFLKLIQLSLIQNTNNFDKDTIVKIILDRSIFLFLILNANSFIITNLIRFWPKSFVDFVNSSFSAIYTTYNTHKCVSIAENISFMFMLDQFRNLNGSFNGCFVFVYMYIFMLSIHFLPFSFFLSFFFVPIFLWLHFIIFFCNDYM